MLRSIFLQHRDIFGSIIINAIWNKFIKVWVAMLRKGCLVDVVLDDGSAGDRRLKLANVLG